MTGVEVLGAVSAAMGLLETAVGIIARIRKANEQQKGLVTVIDKHTNKVASTQAIIQVVEVEECLRTAAVVASVVTLKTAAKEPVSFSEAQDPAGKSSGRQFMHQLISGSKAEATLSGIMTDLARAKANLTLYLQAVNVNLTKTVGDQILADTAIIQSIDKLLQDVLGGGNGLKFVEMLKDRDVQVNATAALNDPGTGSLPDQIVDNCAGSTVRIIVDNVTKAQALQINGPIGVDMWREIGHLEIRGNQATDDSIQVNYPITVDTLDKILEARKQTQQFKTRPP